MKKHLLAAVAALTLLSGCGALSVREGSAVETIAIQYATIRVANEDPARAAKIIEIATEAKTFFSDEAATVPFVKDIIAQRIAKLGLSSADAFLASALLEVVAQELTTRVGNGAGLISPEKRLRINGVLDSVITAAKFAGG